MEEQNISVSEDTLTIENCVIDDQDIVTYFENAQNQNKDVDEILDVADRIIVLVEGKVVMDVNAGETSKDKIVNKMSEVA